MTDTATRPTSPTSTRQEARTRRRFGLRLLAIALVIALDVVTAIWAWSTFSLGLWLVGSVVVILLIGINIAVFVVRAVALRWLLPTLAFMLAFALAPIVYTGYIALTNYSGVHLLTQQQAVEALERQTFVPEGQTPYDWAAYESETGELAVFLVAREGESLDVPDDVGTGEDDAVADVVGEAAGEVADTDVETGPDAGAAEVDPAPQGDAAAGEPTPDTVFAVEGGEATEATAGTGPFGEPDEEGFPQTIDGHERLDRVQMVTRIGELTDTEFGSGETTYRILSASQAASVQSAYEVDPSTGAVTDRRTGVTYQPTENGYFTSAEGERLSPAYQTFVGMDNVVRLFTNESIRTPFLQILAWTIVFAVAVVTIQFALGIVYALVLNGKAIRPAVSRVVRSVLLLPYVIPAYLMILTWAALFNRQTGLIPDVLEATLGLDPSWVATGTGARLAMLVVGVWLGFPYFLLINTGALQAIPDELLEAASIDGAGPWTRFRRIIFPLLMRMIAPLVVLAAAFNFNNFLVAYLLFGGGPPKPNAQVPAGETDLLISFTYKLSFDFGGSEYALAAVVTVMIFLALTPIVLSQLRYYNNWLKED